MRRHYLQIGLLTAVLITFSSFAFSYYQKSAVTSLTEAETCTTKEAQKSTEMIFEKLVKQFIGAVSF